MATLGIDYDAEQYQPLESFEPLPAGKYEAMIIESERVTTKKGDGELLKLVWQITDGEYAGRKVFDRINLLNPNNQAVEIGMRQLSSICRAVGKLRISDSTELHDTPCLIDLKVRPAGPDKTGVHRDASNEVKGYEAVAPAAPPAPAARTVAPRQPATASAGSARKPWERK